MGDNFLKNANLNKSEIPQLVKEKVNNVKVESKQINIMGINMFYRQAYPPTGISSTGQSILLLHGAAFKSQTWLNLDTISFLAAMGHHIIAVDLPGFGETRSSFSGDKAEFLKEIITTLKLSNVVIISPSMSGGFSIPFLIKHSTNIIGYIPVAPVSTNIIRNSAASIKTPTLIIYGELDTGLGHSSKEDLSLLPNSQVVELPKAKHPAYLDQPEMFHTLIYNFMNELKIRQQ